MINRKEELYDRFELYFPNFAKKSLRYEQTGLWLLTAWLHDGDVVIFNGLENSIYIVPKLKAGQKYLDEDAWKKDFAYHVRIRMHEKQISQKELAETAELSESYLSRCLSGKTDPSFYAAMKIAKAFGCNVNDLYSKV